MSQLENIQLSIVDTKAKIEMSGVVAQSYALICIISTMFNYYLLTADTKIFQSTISIIFGSIAIALIIFKEIATRRLKNLEKLCFFCGSKENIIHHTGTLGKSNKHIGLQPGRYCKHCLEGYVRT